MKKHGVHHYSSMILSILVLHIGSTTPRLVAVSAQKEATFGFLPLKRECTWKYDSLPIEQQMCIDEHIDMFQPKSYVDFANGDQRYFWKALKMNPVEWTTGQSYFKTDIMSWSRLVGAKLCGGTKVEMASDFFRITYAVGLVTTILNPLWFIPKGLSYLPGNVGTAFGKIADFFERPYKKMAEVDKELWDKCIKAEDINSIVYQISYFLYNMQFVAVAVDDFIMPGAIIATCTQTNDKVKELIGGKCSEENIYRRNKQRELSVDNKLRGGTISSMEDETHRKLEDAKERVASAYQLRKERLENIEILANNINNALTAMEDAVEPVRAKIDPIVNELEDLVEGFSPMIKWMENNEIVGILEKMGKVAKYVKCDVAVVCNISKLIEDGINVILKTIGLGSIDEYVDALLDPIDALLPNYDVDVTDLDFTRVLEELEEAFETIESLIEESFELANMARGIIDPSIDAGDALADIDSGSAITKLGTSENGESIAFSCDENYFPVVYSAFHTRLDCGEDIASYMRFPCNGESSCVQDYGGLLACSPNVHSAALDEFDGVSRDILYATYICFHEDGDMRDLNIINDLQQYTMEEGTTLHFKDSGNEFPIGGYDAMTIDYPWGQIPDIDCSLGGRVLEIDNIGGTVLPEMEYDGFVTQSTSDIDNYYYTDLAGTAASLKKWTDFGEAELEDWVLEDPGQFSFVYCPTDEEKDDSYDDGTDVKGYNQRRYESCLNHEECKEEKYEFCKSKGHKGNLDGTYCSTHNWDIKFVESDFCDDNELRKTEYEKRRTVADEYWELYTETAEVCKISVPDCQGEKFCEIGSCQYHEFDFACVFQPEFGRQQLTFAFTQSRNSMGPIKEITCPDDNIVRLVKAEIGRFDTIRDVTDAQSTTCLPSSCQVDPDFLAEEAGLSDSTEPLTARVETYCECGEGYEAEPLLNGTCIECSDGQYRDIGMSKCTSCPTGTYGIIGSPFEGCLECKAGTFNSEVASTSCNICPIGTYNVNYGSTSLDDCVDVPPSHIAWENRTGYEECPAGYESGDDRSRCYSCGPGYVRALGEDQCSPCPSGTYSPGEGGSYCIDAPVGTYQSKSGQSGFTIAPKNYYVPSNASKVPTQCPEGTVTFHEGAESEQECVAEPSFPDCGDFSTCEELLLHLNVSESVLGDGFCWGDPRWCVNTELCDFDHGDCCPETCETAEVDVDKNETDDVLEFVDGYYEYSCHPSTFRCLAPRDNFDLNCTNQNATDPIIEEETDAEDEDCVAREEVWGNGVCDVDQNFGKCNYDGGDCCLKTCRISALEGSCTYSSLMNCRDPNATQDIISPTLHNLPETGLELSWDNVSVSDNVYATDNDPCFDSNVTREETTPPENTCTSWAYSKTWTAIDPSGNVASYTQHLDIQADDKAPEWGQFPEDLQLSLLQEESLHPNTTGWPQITEEFSLPVKLTWDDEVTELPPSSCSQGRKLLRTWSAMDACGNTAVRIQTIELEVKSSAATFGLDLWYMQMIALNGDLDIKKHESSMVGSFSASNDVKIQLDATLTTSPCHAGEDVGYTIVAGGSVHAIKSTFSGDDFGPVSFVKHLKLRKDYMHYGVHQELLDWNSQRSQFTETSIKYATSSSLRTLFDGPVNMTCYDLDSDCVPDDDSEVSDTSKGTVERPILVDVGGVVELEFIGESKYLNTFDIDVREFLLDEDADGSISWVLNVPKSSMVIINVFGELEEYLEKVRLPAIDMGMLTPEQVLLNLPGIEGKVKVRANDGGSNNEIPFSLLAPALQVQLDRINIRGQLAVADLSANECTTEYSPWIGNGNSQQSAIVI